MIDLAKPVFGPARWICGLIIVAVIIAASWWIIATLAGGKSARTEAKLNRNQAEAAIASGTDAVETIGAQGTRESAIDRITRENDHAIRQAEGADAPVSAAVDAVTRERLCRRAVYRQRPECLQFAPAE